MKMECNKIKNLIIPYIYNELSSRKKSRVDTHVSSCPECQSLLHDFKSLMGHFNKSQLKVPPSHLDSKILAKARQNTSFKNKLAMRRKPLKPLYPSWALAAALLGVIMVIWHVSPRIDTIDDFLPQMAQKEERMKSKKLEKNKVGIVKLSEVQTPAPLLNLEKDHAIPVIVESNNHNIEIKHDDLPEDPYNKHPFEPYDDSSRFYRIPSGVDFAAFQHQRGIELKQQGNCQDANHIFERIIKEYPKYKKIRRVYIDSAECYSKMGKKSYAVTQLEIYMKRFPNEEETIKKIIEEIEKQ